jgi:hypothetical protein
LFTAIILSRHAILLNSSGTKAAILDRFILNLPAVLRMETLKFYFLRLRTTKCFVFFYTDFIFFVFIVQV